MDPEQFVIAYTALAAKRLSDASTEQQRAQWSDNLVEAAIAARDIIAPIPVAPPQIEEPPQKQKFDIENYVNELAEPFRHQEGAYEEQDEDEPEDTGTSALQRILEKQRNQPE